MPEAAAPLEPGSAKNDRRTIFGWAMYDWANSAYMTTVAAALLPAYFARAVVPEGGYEIFGRTLDGQTLWGYYVSFGTFIIFLLSPILGAVADFSAAKKRFLRAFAYGGALFTTLFWFLSSGDVLLTLGLFFLTQVGFVSANVFYDGFLPDITTPETIDRVSAKGYAFGYVGGGLQFALALLLVLFHESLGLERGTAVRLSLVMAGVWWLGFAAFALGRLRETGIPHELPLGERDRARALAYARVGFGRVWATTRRIVRFRHLLLFLAAYVIYIDGIQTIINMASVYATDTLKLSEAGIMATFLVVQFVAFGGAYFFGWLAGRVQARPAILCCLAVYALVAVAAYSLPEGRLTPFMALGGAIGFVQGGAQSLSRSLYGSMIPEEASAEFYGFYSVLSKFAAVWGPFIFARVTEETGSGRNGILSLITLFVLGGTLLALVNVEEARASKARWRFESA
ncbi:MAG: MFS transporter [Gemmatimonadota bacterium]